jgi:hypothetical protein
MLKSECKIFPVYTMKTNIYVEVQLHPFFTSSLDGGKWSTSRPCRLSQGKAQTAPTE